MAVRANQFNIPAAPKRYTTQYITFRGVDFASDPAKVEAVRSPVALNVVADVGGYPEKRVGWRTLHTIASQINGLFYFVDSNSVPRKVCHAGNSLYVFDDGSIGDPIYTHMNNARSTAFVHGGKLYILDGQTYLVFDGESVEPVTDNAFVPTTKISTQAEGGGTLLEAVNLLTSMRKNSFYTQAGTKTYVLDGTVDANTTPTVSLNGEFTTEFVLNDARDTITLNADPGDPPGGTGVDNLVVTFSHAVDGYADKINKCRFASWYGAGNNTRVFVSGNPDEPNVDWQSGLYDPTYFPDTGYTQIGADSSPIMGYLLQYSNQLIIKGDNEQDATIYQRSAEYTDNYTPYFPLKQGAAGVGALTPYCFGTLRDDPLFLAKEGVFAVTLAYGGANQQRATQSRSYFVDARLCKEPNLADAVSVTWNGYYIVCVNGHAYVADSRQKTAKSKTESTSFEWYYWDNIPARTFLEIGGELYFGTLDGRICKFNTDRTAGIYNDDGEAIQAVWGTKADDDGDFMRVKNMPKRGSGVMVKPYTRSSAQIYVRTEDDFGRLAREAETDMFTFEDVDFQRLTFETLDSPEIIPINSKVKKYKMLQIIVQNNETNEGFGVYGIIKRFTVGNFVK